MEKIVLLVKGILAVLQQLNDGKSLMLNSFVVKIFIGDDSDRVTLENFRKCQFLSRSCGATSAGFFRGRKDWRKTG
jgi:hypothetical protein